MADTTGELTYKLKVDIDEESLAILSERIKRFDAGHSAGEFLRLPEDDKKDSWILDIYLDGRETLGFELHEKPLIEWDGDGDSLCLQIISKDFIASFSHKNVIGFQLSKE